MVKLWEYSFGGTPRECAANLSNIIYVPARQMGQARFQSHIKGAYSDIAVVASEGAACIRVRGYGTPSSSGVHITTLR